MGDLCRGADVSATQLPQLPLSIYKLTTLKRLYFKCVPPSPRARHATP